MLRLLEEQPDLTFAKMKQKAMQWIGVASTKTTSKKIGKSAPITVESETEEDVTSASMTGRKFDKLSKIKKND